MSNSALNWARPLPIKGTAKAVLMALADRANQSEECWPSHATIARDTGLAKSTVRVALNRLRDYGLISWAPRYAEGGRCPSSNRFRLHVGRTMPEKCLDLESARVMPGAGLCRDLAGGMPGAGTGYAGSRQGGVPGAGHKPSVEPSSSSKGTDQDRVHVGGRKGAPTFKL